MRPMSKPLASWKPGLSTNEREETWKFAAGPNKSNGQHKDARRVFVRKAKENAAEAKNGVGLTIEDRAVLTRKQDRLSRMAAYGREWRQQPQNRAKYDGYFRTYSAFRKAKAHALHTKRAAESKLNGTGRTTDFGLGEVPRADELECAAYDIMNNPAGVLCPKGEATTSNWIRDHGEKSIYEVASSGNWAVYVLTTKQDITSGIEIKCSETTKFMSCYSRSPLMRIDTVDNGNQRDFRRFTVKEAKTVVRSYILAKCVSAYDATGLEGSLQRYIEKEMGMSHGLCLHQKAGAAPKLEYGSTNPETTWVAVSLIRLTSPTFADVDHVDPNRSPPLLTCTITSHDGKITYNVGVRGDKQKFPCTKSVVADEAKNAASRLHTSTRRKKRKADAMSRHEDTLSVQ